MAMSESAVVNAGERLALQCAVIKGGLPLSIIWLKEDSIPPPSSGISVKLINDFTATLTVESLTGHHAGRYTCTATNPAGRAQSSVLVIVQGTHYNNNHRDVNFLHDRLIKCNIDRFIYSLFVGSGNA